MVDRLPDREEERIEADLERQIDQHTCRRVRWLQVCRNDGQVVVRGVAPTYYVKQLALQAIQDIRDARQDLTVRDHIEVRPAAMVVTADL